MTPQERNRRISEGLRLAWKRRKEKQMPRQQLQHGMLLRAKNVMDDALPDLEAIRELIPEKLHPEFEKILETFEETLCTADVSEDYQEKSDEEEDEVCG